MLRKIISGAQTGADQAGLAAAIRLGLDTGGFVPRGGRTEDGPLTIAMMDEYKLVETESRFYHERTVANVRSSDATVVFGILSPGSTATIEECHRQKKPCIVNPTAERLRTWIKARQIEVLNVAGNRASVNPQIYAQTYNILIEAFQEKTNGKV